MKRKTNSIIVVIVVLLLAVAGCLAVSFFLSRQTYDVTFYSNDGTPIKVEGVKRNNRANPPVEPKVTYGTVFSKWDKDFFNIKGKTDITAICESFTGKTNTFAVSGAYGKKGDTVFIPLQLCGEVCLSGFELTVKYDASAVELNSVFNEDGAIIYNAETPGIVRINYVSTENTTADVDICSFKFNILTESGESPISITVDSICAFGEGDSIVTPETNIINSIVNIG